ncbi:6-carboxytetrahydropterin synthase [Chitinophaga sp. CF418]|uniref:6-pyruvoyl trahydropterin synthase family protein n=1 Tax=Chitinophaga sp. CF418 TaxID=1855287 RepID=UPI0009102917|nr:6-carboxytetrahydropterin synthase [Chitinophaga sp. CF418]SHM72397.1 6-pyruvoyltetrahydropterin/6-carboxytetrahydropterin synthase [Chitinophaga sp. CF418]
MKQIIRITKIFRFEMAHALSGHNGLCRHIHGHSYQLEVTIGGEPDNTPGHSGEGMVLDFAGLKAIVQQEIILPLDHALMLKNGGIPPFAENDSELFGKIVWVPWQPTCENMVLDFSRRIISKLPERVELCSLKLYETDTSYAEWYASDNL